MQAIELNVPITHHQIFLQLPDTVKATHAKVIVMFEDKKEWDSFFLSNQGVSDDFMAERAEQTESVRESFDA